jgi:hypothetical protein
MKPSSIYELNHHGSNMVGAGLDTLNTGKQLELKTEDGNNQVENNKINNETNKSKGINPVPS